MSKQISNSIGIFSGTFDPIHNGHITFAEAAIDQAVLNEVIILVQHQPWNKHSVSAFEHRLTMTKLATEYHDKISVLDEAEVGIDKVHTVNQTLSSLQEYFKEQNLTLLLGGDVFENIENWQDHQKLIDEVSFVVGLRGEDDGEIILPMIERLSISAKMIAPPSPLLNSTIIRNGIDDERQINNLNLEVYEYIKENGLYH